MDKGRFIGIWGSAANLARAMGEEQATVRAWFNRGSIPAQHDAKIIAAAKTAGRNVTPQDLFDLRQSLLAGREVRVQQNAQQGVG